MMWKLCGKAQESVRQNFHTMKLGEITVFYTVLKLQHLEKLEKLKELILCKEMNM